MTLLCYLGIVLLAGSEGAFLPCFFLFFLISQLAQEQKSGVRNQNSRDRSFQCFEYGDVSDLSRLLEEVGKLLEVYSPAILNSDS